MSQKALKDWDSSGDRLTEANCQNLQWAFADGVTKEDRLEGMVFKFEDWHVYCY